MTTAARRSNPRTVSVSPKSPGSVSWSSTSRAALQQIVDGVAAGRYPAIIQRRFRLEEIVEAHRLMEENRRSGTLVVPVDA